MSPQLATVRLSTTLLLLLLLLLTPVATLLPTQQQQQQEHEQAPSSNGNGSVRLRRQSLAASSSGGSSSAASSAYELQGIEQKFSLPSVPLPPPPPFPSVKHNFALNAFAAHPGSASAAATAGSSGSNSIGNGFAEHSSSRCGGMLRSRYGIIQTPNFPHRFVAPIECVWIIDASELPVTAAAAKGGNVSIVVYLTQLYVLGGLKFTEYMYYSDDYKVPAHRVFTLTEDDVTQVSWVQFNSQYLEIRFSMASLDGTHLRALDRLLDVYGFNITYEVQHEVKPTQCNTLQCRFLGNCYANADFSSYGCACFAGFTGSDCGHGPLCKDPHTNVCQNGGTCKHIGDAAITCHCPAGYKGTKCEIPEINETTQGCIGNASANNCHQACDFDNTSSGYSMLRSSRTAARSGKTRYEVAMRLGANLTSYYRNAEREQLAGVMERQLTRVLRNFNITKISDLELISNTTDRLDITFHFFGIKGDSQRIREAITRMVERGRIGNFTLVSNFHQFYENPPLNLLELSVNQPQAAVREDSEFIISCTAQGSSRMQFQWFKDGAAVNATKATREIWTTVLPPETKDVFTAILGVTKASRIDEGTYSCKVTDWGVEQCRSLHIHIKSPPRLRVDPASVTLQRGDSLRVRCLSPGNDDIKRYAQLGYSWTRNGVLFQSDPTTAMWEDLYPDGSILKINNIQKSAEYACLVSNSVRPVSRSVYINVIERNAAHVCLADSSYGIHWPTSAPGAPIITDCPRGFEGHSRRICEQRDAGNSSWLLPDFSACVRDELLLIYNRYRALSAGFQQTNSSNILKACFEYTLQRSHSFLPGEASFLIDVLHELDTYLQLKGTQLEREMAAEIILRILDKVMQNAQSLNSQQQIKKLQLLTQSAALNRETIAASQLATSTGLGGQVGTATAANSVATNLNPPNSNSNAGAAGKLRDVSSGASSILTVDEDTLSLDRLNSLRIYMTSVKTLPFNLRIYGEDLFSDQLYMEIGLSSRLLHIMANSTIFASVISYKNLKSFLPKTYYTRGSDPKDSDYVLASRIIQTWLFQSNRSNDNFREPLDLPFESGHVEIIFQHESVPKIGDWMAVCGHDYKASFESTWRSDLCITKHLMENITRCICPLSGTYVVMLTKRQQNSTLPHAPQRPIFVIISCACCLLQCCSAFLILLPIWCNRKCAVTFLKMQFCISTSSVMLIYLLGFLKMLPMNWHAIVSSSLASLLLLGISTLIAIALVIHSELMPKKYLQIGGAAAGGSATGNSNSNSKPPTPTKHQQEITMLRRESLSNITQISAQASSVAATLRPRGRMPPNSLSPQLPTAGIRGAIGISWLLPLLFAIASPLICSIIGKWPRHWWLEIMWTGKQEQPQAQRMPQQRQPDADLEGDGDGLYYATHQLLNGDNLLLESEALLGNVTVRRFISNDGSAAVTERLLTTLSDANNKVSPAMGSSISSMETLALSTTTMTTASITTAAERGAGVTAAALTWPQTQTAKPWQTAALTSVYGQATGAGNTSLSFILFMCIDLLFILLFFALFGILMKKLLWIWQKNCNMQAHPLAKFNIAMRRRVGLLYRTGALLIIKLCTDGFFIVYVNSPTDTLWAYPFGISCILLGFAILFCFIIKAESQLRGPAFLSGSGGGSGSNGSSQSSSLKQNSKFNTSKTSLDDNYGCSASINSPLSFYTSHDKEKESECMPAAGTAAGGTATLLQAKQGLELSVTAAAAANGAGVQLPLTIISTAPRCQPGNGNSSSIPAGVVAAASTTETFLAGPAVGALLEQTTLTPMTVASPATRCCALLGSGGGSSSSGNAVPTQATKALGYVYDTYTMGGGSLSRRALHQHQQHLQLYQPPNCADFVGVETLDILQGVAADSIIGIHTSGILPTATAAPTPHYVPLQHNPYVDFVLSMPAATAAAAVAPPPPTISGNLSAGTLPTPKTQKRVTILEPTSHTTFDPLLPTMVAAAASNCVTATTITNTQTDGGGGGAGSEDATLDRITHDLDYLLNRGGLDLDAGTPMPSPPPPPAVVSKTCDSQQQQQQQGNKL